MIVLIVISGPWVSTLGSITAESFSTEFERRRGKKQTHKYRQCDLHSRAGLVRARARSPPVVGGTGACARARAAAEGRRSCRVLEAKWSCCRRPDTRTELLREPRSQEQHGDVGAPHHSTLLWVWLYTLLHSVLNVIQTKGLSLKGFTALVLV